jgi:hypothetical protein
MIPSLIILRCIALLGHSFSLKAASHHSLACVTLWPDFIEGLGWFEQLTLANLGDLSDSFAQVVSAQVDLNPDSIAFGDLLLLQDVGIGDR